MSVVAAAVVGSAIIGAVSSNQASKRQADTAKAGLKSANALQQSAIQQAQDYFGLGQKSAQAGYQSALDLFKASQAAKYQPMIQGNVAAQRVIGQGATQANNAILGLPVDMSFANNPTALQPDLSSIQNAQLPVVAQPDKSSSLPIAPEAQAPAAMSKNEAILTAGGYAANPKDMLDPRKVATNPLGLGAKVDKLNPKKLIKKIF